MAVSIDCRDPGGEVRPGESFASHRPYRSSGWSMPPRLTRVSLALAALLAVMPPAPAFAADPVVGTCGAPGAPAGPQIQVVVTGARKVAGNITFTLYGPRPEAFLARGGRIGRQRITMRGPQTEACFAVSAPGSYAIAVYQDENNDHKFDRTMLGMPAEGYGFSNDAPAVLGLPSYESARFQVGAAGARLPIALRH